MPNHQPIIKDARGVRSFATSAAAVLVFLVDADERLLLLSGKPARLSGHWEVPSGAVQAEETILDAALRELHEEIGPEVSVRPLGTVHVHTFRYDDEVQYMICVCYLMAYEGGPIVPGDDMAGSQFRWWNLAEIMDDSVRISVPTDQKWLMSRSVELYRLWKHSEVPLQPWTIRPAEGLSTQ